MSWREDYIYQNYLSRTILLLINKQKDEIELETCSASQPLPCDSNHM